jgi:hypothetical protein
VAELALEDAAVAAIHKAGAEKRRGLSTLSAAGVGVGSTASDGKFTAEAASIITASLKQPRVLSLGGREFEYRPGECGRSESLNFLHVSRNLMFFDFTAP